MIPCLAVCALLVTATSIAAATATVSGVPHIYLRSGPGTTYAPNGIVAGGESVTTLEQVGNWHRVETGDGRAGFLYSGYLRMGAPSEVTPAPATTHAADVPVAVTSPAAESAEAGQARSFQEELASLKAEVSRLRSEVGRGGTAPPSPAAGSAAALTLPTRVPVEIAPSDAEASNLRTAGVAAFFLVVGWIFGAGFARRKSRSQRGRLRF